MEESARGRLLVCEEPRGSEPSCRQNVHKDHGYGVFAFACLPFLSQQSHLFGQVRDKYERWISIQYYSDEAARLGQFMCAAIYDKTLRDVIDGLPDAGRDTAESTIISIMQGMVKGAAGAAFSAFKAGVEKAQPLLTEKMKPLIEP